VPGKHNASNALAALAAVHAAGVGLGEAAQALSGFNGLRRRLELVGTRSEVSVIDDFGHNPDKIAATLDTLHAFPGRLLVFFQPHGYGPLRVLRDALIETFAGKLASEDVLILTDPVYHGGTVDRTVGSADIIAGVVAAGRQAEHVPERTAAGERLAALARPGDRIVIMGARDDTLSHFAEQVLQTL
jgi:UDP-N-acetylmuramate--alanine ligase